MKKFASYFMVIASLAALLAGCGNAEIQKVDKPAANNAETPAEQPSEQPAAEESAETEAPAEEAAEQEAPLTEVFAIGDSVQFEDLILTVNSVRESQGEFITPAEGNVFVLVDVTAENTGEEEAAISSIMNTEAVDGDGYSYSITITEDMKGSFDGSVAPGRKLRGEVAFEVPADASLEFIFSDPFLSGQAIWKIK